ncbi:MAG: 4'-phosphopantetheinyl transferase superfamily protein [Proteobacteria bacterium]|nr:4'-phosphopantetheinyl transferase superfamily protein [Pseudomonadota bacterium]
MVGNDVVDLSDPETRPETLHPRFDGRVFDAIERAQVDAADDPDRQRWRLWAAKEATYKLVKKLAPATVFSPRRFLVRFDGSPWGQVQVGARRFGVQLIERAREVHAIAMRLEDLALPLVHGVRRLERDEPAAWLSWGPSTAVRRFGIEAIARAVGARAGEFSIVREGRIPKLVWRDRPAPADLSLSHHGELVAFACSLKDPAPWSPAKS